MFFGIVCAVFQIMRELLLRNVRQQQIFSDG